MATTPAIVTDTIAAIATALGGGVGIVRLSGPRAETIARTIVPSLPRSAPSHRLFLGDAIDPVSGDVLDEVLAVVMRGPRSYTGEDVAELHGHGGLASMQALLDATLTAGARLATAGEFTRRAFAAGKIDLTQAEAVVSLIAADSQRALRAAQALRGGRLGREVDEARRKIVTALAELEGALDFPDEADADRRDGIAGDGASSTTKLAALATHLHALAAGFRRPLGVTPEVLLVGQVNAGKSSLMNALVGQERALVDEQPGTTRDVIEAEFELPETGRLRLVDTAGARAGASGVEARGQALAEARRAQAALVLLVYDGACGWQPEDEALQRAIHEQQIPLLIVENKADLPRAGASATSADVRVSATRSDGMDTLRAALAHALKLGDDSALPVASARQAAALSEAAAGVVRATELLPRAGEIAVVELRRALHQLGLVTGETVDEEVLDAIFSRFCIGK